MVTIPTKNPPTNPPRPRPPRRPRWGCFPSAAAAVVAVVTTLGMLGLVGPVGGEAPRQSASPLVYTPQTVYRPSVATTPRSTTSSYPADPARAAVRVVFGDRLGSATIIGPPRPDGRWFALTAAHCCPDGTRSGKLRFPGGLELAVSVVRSDAITDVSLLEVHFRGQLPYAEVDVRVAPPGSRVQHYGYGVGRARPGVVGVVDGPVIVGGSLPLIVPTLDGDSGAGVFLQPTGRLIGVVSGTLGRVTLAPAVGPIRRVLRGVAGC